MRWTPTERARSRWPPQCGHSQAASERPSQPQTGRRSAAPAASTTGPWQAGQRAARRQVWQARPGRYPARGTCTRTGPRVSPSRIARHAVAGRRPAADGSSAAPGSAPAIATAARRARSTGRSAATGRAQPDRSQTAQLGGRREPGGDHRGVLALGAQPQHLAGVRVRRPLLDVQVVAVVPDRDQPEVGDRRERRGAGADGDPDVPAAQREEGAVAGGRPEVGLQAHVAPGAEGAGERRVDDVDVPAVRQHEQAAAPGGQGGVDGGREPGRPVRGLGAAGALGARERRPDGPWRPAGRQPGQEGRTGRVGRPGTGSGVSEGQLLAAGRRGLLLGAGVPGRHREAQDVAEGAGVRVRDRPRQARDLRRQHRLR